MLPQIIIAYIMVGTFLFLLHHILMFILVFYYKEKNMIAIYNNYNARTLTYQLSLYVFAWIKYQRINVLWSQIKFVRLRINLMKRFTQGGR